MKIPLKKTGAYVGAALLLSVFAYAAFNRDDRQRIWSTDINEHFPVPPGSEVAYLRFLETFAEEVPVMSMQPLWAKGIGEAGYAEAVLKGLQIR
jgi:hypothetical protein